MVKKIWPILLLLVLAWGSMAWAADSLTSRTSTVAGLVVTHRIYNVRDGCFLYLKYDPGTGISVSISVTTIPGAISATDEYNPVFVGGAGIAISAQTFTTGVLGNYRIPIALYQGENIIKATVTFTGGTDDQILVVDFADS